MSKPRGRVKAKASGFAKEVLKEVDMKLSCGNGSLN